MRSGETVAKDILHFWFEECAPSDWFRNNPEFDQRCRERFAEIHDQAAKGDLDAWRETEDGALALILILDQLSRNIHRGTSEAFAQDAKARDIANGAISSGFDKAATEERRAFFYMPFMHSEALADQEKSVELFSSQLPASSNVKYAIQHRDIIKRFGRFPHRNEVLGRDATPEEIEYLEGGGFNP